MNHSISFADSDSGVHTSTIEDTWNGLKQAIRPRNRTKTIKGYLMEFILYYVLPDTLVKIRIKYDSFHRHFSNKQYRNSDCLGSLQSACSFH